MKFYDTSEPLYLGTGAPGMSLGARLLKVRDGMNWGQDEVLNNTALYSTAFISMCLSSIEWWYSNIEQEALDILCGLVKFNHYCFSQEVNVITGDKPSVAVVSKDLTTLSLSSEMQQVKVQSCRCDRHT